VVAANEAATNSVLHGGGSGAVRAWTTDDALVCEVRDSGRIEDPVVGRVRPKAGTDGGHGLWLAHQVCDLVQVRSHRRGTAVRLHMRLRGAAAA
jgi:anti-sigma regulatory factor (Ser/Thr protein kinase)